MKHDILLRPLHFNYDGFSLLSCLRSFLLWFSQVLFLILPTKENLFKSHQVSLLERLLVWSSFMHLFQVSCLGCVRVLWWRAFVPSCCGSCFIYKAGWKLFSVITCGLKCDLLLFGATGNFIVHFIVDSKPPFLWQTVSLHSVTTCACPQLNQLIHVSFFKAHMDSTGLCAIRRNGSTILYKFICKVISDIHIDSITRLLYQEHRCSFVS